MKTEKEINEDILKITMKIKDQFPELSSYILEMPVTVPNTEDPKINRKIVEDYYDSLEILLQDYLENKGLHKK